MPEIDLTELLQGLSEEFDSRCDQRHKMGAQKYGPGKFLEVDTFEEAMQEIIDLANYARYTYIRLRLLQIRNPKLTDNPVLGRDGFLNAKEMHFEGGANPT